MMMQGASTYSYSSVTGPNSGTCALSLRDSAERELTETVCRWTQRSVIFFGGSAGLVGYLVQHPNYIYPLSACLTAATLEVVLVLLSLLGLWSWSTTTTTSTYASSKGRGEKDKSTKKKKCTSSNSKSPKKETCESSLPSPLATCCWIHQLAHVLPTTLTIGVICVGVMHQALTHGCSASHVPVLYGFIPCVFSSLFRSTRAILASTLFVLVLLGVIFGLDLTDQCPTSASGSYVYLSAVDAGDVLLDRLAPFLTMLVVNAALLVAIVQQSQKALLLQAEATKSAAQLAQIQRDVLHRVTHELRTPLNGMVGSVELLTTSDTLPEGDMENALTIQRCLENILRICDDVLKVAKKSAAQHGKHKTSGDIGSIHPSGSATPAEAAPLERQWSRESRILSPLSTPTREEPQKRISSSSITSKPTPFRLASALDDVSDMFAAAAAAKNLDFKVEFVGNTNAHVRGMHGELRQVLMNLVGNSMKFTATGSIVVRALVLRDEDEEEDWSTAKLLAGRSRSKDDYEVPVKPQIVCRFEVEDTGIGVSKEESAMLFEPFYQAEQGGAVGRHHGGTGLGLTICAEMVKAMGGTIQVDGEQGQGSKFHFTLSLDQEGDPNEAAYRISKSKNKNQEWEIVITDAAKESSSCVQSIIDSMAPESTRVQETPLDMLVSFLEAYDPNICRVAFLACTTKELNDLEGLRKSLLKLKEHGWKVIAYCDQALYPKLVSLSDDCFGVFRRPIQLVRATEMFSSALKCEDVLTSRGTRKTKKLQTISSLNEDEPSVGKPTVPGGSPEQPKVEFNGPNGLFSLNTPISTLAPKTETKSLFSMDPKPACEAVTAKKTEPSPAPSNAPVKKPEAKSGLNLAPGSKIVVVDDTPINVKVLVKMVTKATSEVPIVSCYDGQSAIDAYTAAAPTDKLLFLMDWHMPGICGLSASDVIRQKNNSLDRTGPRVYIIMVTADAEGLRGELQRREIQPTFGSLVKGSLIPNESGSDASPEDSDDGSFDCKNSRRPPLTSDSSLSPSTSSSRSDEDDVSYTMIDILAEKPITFKSINAMLSWFNNQP